MWRPVVARAVFSQGTSASQMASVLDRWAHDPRGEVILLRATADGAAFGQALGAEAARLGLAPAEVARAGRVVAGAVSRILGERVRAAAAGQLTAKIKQVDHLAAVMRGQVHDPAALEAFFQRFGAVPAVAREAVLDAHHLGVAGHLTGDPTLYLFSRSEAGARARAELVATGHAEIVGTPVSLAEMADGLAQLREELVAARDYAWKAKEPLLVFRPVVRQLATQDPRYAEAFALRRAVTGGTALADPEHYGFGVDAWHRLTGRDVDFARSLWAAGVVDHGEVTHAREAWAARLGGQVVSLGAGFVALPEALMSDALASVEGQAERAVLDATGRLVSRGARELVERVGVQAAVKQLTAQVRAAAEREVAPAVRAAAADLVSKVVARTGGKAGTEAAAKLATRLIRPLSSAAGNALSRAASRSVAQAIEALGGNADPAVERVTHQVGLAESRLVGTYLGGPTVSLGGLLASYVGVEGRGLHDPATAVAPGYRWNGGLPPDPGAPGR